MNDALFLNKKVLIVEDDDACRFLFELMLEEAGCSFVTARDGQEAVSKTKLDKFDLIFMDLRLPVMSGYDATALIREIDKDVPIIALTAHAMARDDGKCQACGINDYLIKPCTKEQLIEKLLQWTIGK